MVQEHIRILISAPKYVLCQENVKKRVSTDSQNCKNTKYSYKNQQICLYIEKIRNYA